MSDRPAGRGLRAALSARLMRRFGAVVVPGSRAMKGDFAEKHSLNIATPMIVKYRDEKTDSGTALEEALR